MTVDFSPMIKTLTGEVVRTETDAPLTLRLVAVNALLTERRDEQVSAEDKVQRWKLACAIHGAATLPLPVEDIALIKRLIGVCYGPLVVGQAFELLEAQR